jgi:phospholipid/cholesterol/gamma-HCH transport system substrate-binding protein
VTISKEAKVGLLALVSGVVLYLGFNFLKGSDFFSTSRRYFAIYDNIDGLTVSNAVMLNGMTVGKVQKITILPNRNNRLLVRIEVDSDINLNESSQAILATNGLLGDKIIRLQIGRGNRVLEKDDTLKASVEAGIASMMMQKAQPVLDNLDSLAITLNRTVGQFDSTGYLLKQTLANFKQSSAAINSLLANNRSSLNSTIANFNKLSASLADTEKGIKPLLGKMNNFADTLSRLRLNQAVVNANKSIAQLNAILTDIQAGKGTMGKLAKNDSLYTNLNRTTADLDRLLVDFRRNPKRYVHFSLFGSKEKPDKKTLDSLRVKKRKELSKNN